MRHSELRAKQLQSRICSTQSARALANQDVFSGLALVRYAVPSWLQALDDESARQMIFSTQLAQRLENAAKHALINSMKLDAKKQKLAACKSQRVSVRGISGLLRQRGCKKYLVGVPARLNQLRVAIDVKSGIRHRTAKYHTSLFQSPTSWRSSYALRRQVWRKILRVWGLLS